MLGDQLSPRIARIILGQQSPGKDFICVPGILHTEDRNIARSALRHFGIEKYIKRLLQLTNLPEERWGMYDLAQKGSIQDQEGIGYAFCVAGYSELAELWWTSAAEKGSIPALFQLGVRALRDGDLEKSKKIFQKLSQRPDRDISSKAYHNLGTIALRESDRVKGMENYVTAFNLGNTSSGTTLAYLYLEIGDKPNALAVFRICHKRGEADATFMCSQLVDDPVEKNKFLREASRRGYWKAELYIGVQILVGHTISRDWRDAQNLIKASVDKIPASHSSRNWAIILLWYMDLFGDGELSDEMILPFKMASIMYGDINAIPDPPPSTLGEMASRARDDTGKFRDAFIMFDVSADTDGSESPQVHLNLGFLCYLGLGTNTDRLKAHLHFQKYIDLSEPGTLVYGRVTQIMSFF